MNVCIKALDDLQDFIDEATHESWPGDRKPPQRPLADFRGATVVLVSATPSARGTFSFLVQPEGGRVAAKRGVSRRVERPMTAGQIVEAGLSLLDEVSIAGFSSRALAERLGTYPATLYWHVGNRARLLAAIVDRVLGELDLLEPGSVPWQQWLRHGAWEYRKVLHRHPNVGPLVGTQLTVSVPGIRLVEVVLTVLEGAGFRGKGLAHAYNSFVGSLIGWVSLELCANPPDAEQAWYEEFASAVRTLEPDDFPVIASHRDHLADAVFALRWHGGADRPMDGSFEFAVETWIAGLAVRLG